ncbi:MAG TPA: peptide deformylase [Candidatus Polarisedimenticolia bacterium]|jgi:peptide deformylase|nr:peptide deformylase [Candidatus Polarisedimenticolia bacterium]
MAILPILRFPHEVLATDSGLVREITPDVERLVQDMIETMHAAPGVGLAANQVGVARQIAVVDLSVGEKPEEVLVLINPRILENAGSYIEDEGCLSLPGFTERVTRPDRCVIEAMDLAGKVRTLEGRDLLARAFNHEIDHLHGRLFIEHLSPLKRRLIKRKVQKRMRAGDWDLVPA